MKFYIKLGEFPLSLSLSLSLFSVLRALLPFSFSSAHRALSHPRPRPLYIYVPIDRYIGVCIYIDIAVSPATTRDVCATG